MTGSGKTGLGIDLIEECAIDGVPVIAIDPKGDLGNLLLTFPKLAAEDFLPWVDPDEARRAGQTVEAFAAAEATRWSKGLADWGQDGKRIERLRDAAEFALYTPGSSSGRPLSIMKSFAAPDPGDRQRCRATAGSRVDGGHERADAGRGRCRADQEPRARPACQPLHGQLARRPRSGSAGADRADSVAADRQGRRARSRELLPVEGSLRAGHAAEPAARGARVSAPGSKARRSTSIACSTG